ncbi:hypothetical protein [Streptomyces sp. NPDC051173]|uniref:hypothetical protein n=1 Tax=Streptomyces sp. NPDC051173 TaxID=3155164 RepID=UPI00344C93BB
MRIQLAWPNTADAVLTLTVALPDFSSDSYHSALRRALTYAGPVLAGVADAAGAGLLAHLLLPFAVHLVQQALENPERSPQHDPGHASVHV